MNRWKNKFGRVVTFFKIRGFFADAFSPPPTSSPDIGNATAVYMNYPTYKDNYTNNLEQNYEMLLKALIRSPGTDISFPASSTAEELTLLILFGGLPGRNGTWNMEVQIG